MARLTWGGINASCSHTETQNGETVNCDWEVEQNETPDAAFKTIVLAHARQHGKKNIMLTRCGGVA